MTFFITSSVYKDEVLAQTLESALLPCCDTVEICRDEDDMPMYLHGHVASAIETGYIYDILYKVSKQDTLDRAFPNIVFTDRDGMTLVCYHPETKITE